MLFEILQDHSKTLGDVKQDIAEIKTILGVNVEDLKEHMQQTKLVRESVEILKQSELNCPGRKAAEWRAGFVHKAKDIGIVVGLIITIVNLLRIWP